MISSPKLTLLHSPPIRIQIGLSTLVPRTMLHKTYKTFLFTLNMIVKDIMLGYGAPLLEEKPKGGVYPWPSKSALKAISIAQFNTTSITTPLN
ncbi:hypothetical protein HAX54_021703 [Datura stramonium]|uniref:Uncharacterized protein n=1 Tax=Datura stramonium TaxID=4076 RepID=A0ABS8UUP0_DATST|nr:hypothetical protein [Datura stramonium]